MKTRGTTYYVVSFLKGKSAHQAIDRAIRNTPDLLSVVSDRLDVMGAKSFDLVALCQPSLRSIGLTTVTRKIENDRVVPLDVRILGKKLIELF